MKKSPLSTPGGSRPNWKGQERRNRTGCNYVKNDSYECSSPNENPGNDFIPLNISSPLPERNWRGSRARNHRNSGSGGFNHYRNNYHSSPKSNFNNLYSPYKHSGKQFYTPKKGYQRDVRKRVDISNYVDMTSFLEDPWADLMRKLNDSKVINDTEMSESVYVESKSELELDTDANRTDSSIDIKLENVTFESNCSNNDSGDNVVGCTKTTNVIQDLV